MTQIERDLHPDHSPCQSGDDRTNRNGCERKAKGRKVGKFSLKSDRTEFWSHVYQAATAGALGGMAQGILIWLFGQLGLFILVRLPLAPPLTLPWIYQRMVWGGIWGVFFLLPVVRHWPHWKRGWLIGLFPAAGSLFYFLPFQDGHGWLGLYLGGAMPFVVIFFGWVWGLMTGIFLARTGLYGEQRDLLLSQKEK